ncbi:MAG TPA: hypothetical protein DCS30_19790, partial [Rhizobiales bacterium]|nr:hypothetical protein [Hyphomicrobiales bacterium]
MTNSNEVLINNARIVLEDQVLSGHIQIRDGKISDIGEGVLTNGAAAQAEDFDGDYLLPGFVELHTDHVEGHYAPRPSVR